MSSLNTIDLSLNSSLYLSQKKFSCCKLNDPSDRVQPYIWLNKQDFEQWFAPEIKNHLPALIQISTFIFQVSYKDWLKPSEAALSCDQITQLEQQPVFFLQNQKAMAVFTKVVNPPKPLSQVVLIIEAPTNLSEQPLAFSVEDIKKEIVPILLNKPLNENQAIYHLFQNAIWLKMTVKKLVGEEVSQRSFKLNGTLVSTTELYFIPSASHIHLINEVEHQLPLECNFEISLHQQLKPEILNIDAIKGALYEALRGSCLAVGHQFNWYNGHIHIACKLTAITHAVALNSYSIKSVRINSDTKISFTSADTNLILVRSNIGLAEEATFHITEVLESSSYHLNLETITEAIKQLKQLLIPGQRYIMPTASGKVVIKFMSASGHGHKDEISNKEHIQWHFYKLTQLKYTAEPQLTFIENDRLLALASIKIRIPELNIAAYRNVEEQIRDYLMATNVSILVGDTCKLLSKDKAPYQIEIEATTFENKVKRQNQVYCFGKVTENTMIEFIEAPLQEAASVKLEQLAGGVPYHLKTAIDFLADVHGPLQSYYKQRNLFPPRGIIFHGPQGMQMDYIAEKISTVFDARLLVWGKCETNKVQDLFDVLHRDLKEQKFVVVVIKDLESLLTAREDRVLWERETIRHFYRDLEQLDAYAKCLFIGLTPNLQFVDKQALASQYFPIQISFHELDDKQREAIFEFFLRKAKASKVIALDVDLKKLAEHTKGWTRQEIEYFVQEAMVLSLNRIKTLKAKGYLDEAINQHPDHLIVMKDFEETLKLFAKERVLSRLRGNQVDLQNFYT